MCLYCNMGMGWGKLLEYDDVYQETVGGTTEATYGFQDSYDELREQVGSP